MCTACLWCGGCNTRGPRLWPPILYLPTLNNIVHTRQCRSMMMIMDIEKLNKSQIVLLTLLVSFVTSIATGIVTVSLMDQAPPVIPQTINRVVERTVEKVVPQETQAAATVVTREKTVTVKEADVIADAVARVRGSFVRVHYKEAEGVAGSFVSRGVVAAEGYVVMSGKGVRIGETYIIPTGENMITAQVIAIDGGHTLALLSLGENTFTAAAFAGTPILGQTVVALSGQPNIKVADGIVTSLSEDTGTFETSVAADTLIPGALVTNSDGAVIGMFIERTKPLVPAEAIISLVRSLSSEQGSAAE